MIRGVTEAVGNTAAADRTKKSRTTITPFEKVLEQSTIKYPEKSKMIQPMTADTDQTSNTSVPTSLQSIFQRASEKYDVPYNFLTAVAKAESSFRVNATSKSGAQGIMQLMPATAKSLGVTDAYDPEQNIMAGAKYLASHLKAFDNDTSLAAAAYNAGGAAVRKYDGIPPYSETENYVKIIQKYMNQGVSVPDENVLASVGTSGSTSVDKGEAATEEDLSSSMVVVGSGDLAVTMTYGAYLRYLELGTTGVG